MLNSKILDNIVMLNSKIPDNIVMVVLRYLKKDIELEHCRDLRDIRNIIFAGRLPNNYILIFLLLFSGGFKSI